MPEEKESKKKIIDVSHPDDSMPSDTSKPVIVTNRPILKDPMVIDQEKKAEEDKAPELEKPEEPKPSAQEIQPAELKKELKVEPPAEDKPEEKKPEEPTEDQPATQESFTDEQESDKIKDPDEDLKKEEEAAAKDAALQKLADSKQYYLPINTVEKRKTQRFVFLGIILSVVLALAWLNIALDAELINLGGIKAVTNFF